MKLLVGTLVALAGALGVSALLIFDIFGKENSAFLEGPIQESISQPPVIEIHTTPASDIRTTIFVLDVSGSAFYVITSSALERAKETTGESTTWVQGGPLPFSESIAKIKTRGDFMKALTICALRGLSSTEFFAVIFFAEQTEVWNGKVTQATHVNIMKAISAIERHPSGGSPLGRKTNLAGAFDTALNLVEHQGQIHSSSDVQTHIYFLMDGYVSAGRYAVDWESSSNHAALNLQYGENMHTLVNEIASRATELQAVIHTIGIGEGYDSHTLRQLAQRSGGKHYDYR